MTGPRRRRRAAAVAAGLAVVLAGACSSGRDRGGAPTTAVPAAATTTSPPRPVPGSTWDKIAPAAVGLDPGRLAAVAATAEKGKSNCLVVVRDAKVAGAWYFNGTTADTTQDIYSATKSITSTLVGIAADDGDLDVDDPASKYITEWKGTASASVTIRDLLSNDSGREWSTTIDYRDLLLAA